MLTTVAVFISYLDKRPEPVLRHISQLPHRMYCTLCQKHLWVFHIGRHPRFCSGNMFHFPSRSVYNSQRHKTESNLNGLNHFDRAVFQIFRQSYQKSILSSLCLFKNKQKWSWSDWVKRFTKIIWWHRKEKLVYWGHEMGQPTFLKKLTVLRILIDLHY